MRYFLTCKSLTYAQRSSRILERSGISNTIVKSPPVISDRGCGYSVSVNLKNGRRAAEILRSNNLFGKMFLQTDENGFREEML